MFSPRVIEYQNLQQTLARQERDRYNAHCEAARKLADRYSRCWKRGDLEVTIKPPDYSGAGFTYRVETDRQNLAAFDRDDLLFLLDCKNAFNAWIDGDIATLPKTIKP